MSVNNNNNVKTAASAENLPLRFPVSLETFMKWTHYKEAVDKYVKKNWSKPTEDHVKLGIDKIYRDFYTNIYTRAKCNVQIKACPKSIKEKLLQFALTNNERIPSTLEEGENSKVNLRYPVSLKTFKKYIDYKRRATKYVEKYWLENPLAPEKRTRTDDDLEKEGIQIIYKDFFRNSESRAKLNMRIKPCPDEIKDRLLQYAELIEMDAENSSQMKQCHKVTYANQIGLEYKDQANIVENISIPVESPAKTHLATSEILNPALTTMQDESVKTTMKQSSIDNWLVKSSRKNAEIQTVNPPHIAMQVSPRTDFLSTSKSIEDGTANCKIKEAVGMQNETSSNNVNKYAAEICSFPKAILRYPVSLATFTKYVDHEWRLNKYIKKYWKKTRQAPPERIRTDNDVAQQAIKVLYTVFFRNSESREKLNMQIKPCPPEIKDKLLQYVEEIEVQDNNSNKTNNSEHESDITSSSESNLRYPVSLKTFAKYTHINDAMAKYVDNYWIKNSQAMNKRTDDDIKNEALEMLYKDFYNSIESRAKHNIQIKACPKHTKEKLLQFAELMDTNETNISSKLLTFSILQKPSKSHKNVTYFCNENYLTDEFLLNYIKNKLGDSTKYAAEILARSKKEVLLKTIEVSKPCTYENGKVHIQSVKILKPIVINTDLQEAKELFFQKVAKHHTLQYIIRMNDGIKGDVLSAVLGMSFPEFCKYTRIHKAHSIYNDLPTLRRYYDFALIEHKIWPINLYMQINDLFEYLKLKGIQIKTKEALSLVHISPKLLHWQDIKTVTNYDECVLRYYEESLETLTDEDFANYLRENYYKKCWIHEQWIEPISLLNSEAFLNLNASTTVDLNKKKTQMEIDIETQLETYSQENVDIEPSDIGDWDIFIGMQSKDFNETIQPQLDTVIETALDTCSQDIVIENLLSKESQPCGKVPGETVAVELRNENFIDMPNTQVQIEALPTETNLDFNPLSNERSTANPRYLKESVASAGKCDEYDLLATVKKEPLDKVLFMLDGEENFKCYDLSETVISIDDEIQNSNPFKCMEQINFDSSSPLAYPEQELTSTPSTLVGKELVTFCEAQRLSSTLEEQAAQQQPKTKALQIANKTTMAEKSALAAAATTAVAMPIHNTNIPTKTLTTTKTGQLVPQLTHEFRALPLTKVRKNVEGCRRHVAPSVTISSVDTSNTPTISISTASSFSVSQALASNCTLFESSQLHRATEEHQIQVIIDEDEENFLEPPAKRTRE